MTIHNKTLRDAYPGGLAGAGGGPGRAAGRGTGRGRIARIAVRLPGPTLRAVPWAPILAASVVGTGLVGWPALSRDDLSAALLSNLLRLAAVCAAVGAAFLLDDPAARTVQTTPAPRLLRLSMRVAVALPVLAGGWAIAVLSARSAPNGRQLPWVALSLEAAALIAVALAVAAVQLRRDDRAAGPLTAIVVLTAAVVAAVLDEPIALFPPPGDAHWGPTHRWWALIAVSALSLYAWAAHDRNRRRRLRLPVRARVWRGRAG